MESSHQKFARTAAEELMKHRERFVRRFVPHFGRANSEDAFAEFILWLLIRDRSGTPREITDKDDGYVHNAIRNRGISQLRRIGRERELIEMLKAENDNGYGRHGRRRRK